MQNIFIDVLPPWVETGLQPACYDLESGTVLQQTARMYAKVNEIATGYSTFTTNVTNEINRFEQATDDEIERFEGVVNDTVDEYIQKFNDLHDYVEDYFDNLDVQEEINNKLDEMAQDGTLQECLMIDNIIDVTRPGRNLTPMAFDNTDETEKLQDIIDWALANGGAKIILPVGTTKISKIEISASGYVNITIEGQGTSTILESITNSNDNMFEISGETADDQIDNLVIKNLQVKRSTEQISITAFDLTRVCNQCIIEDVTIDGFDTGIKATQCWTLKLLNNNVLHTNNIGVEITSNSHNMLIEGNKFSFNYNTGIKLNSNYGVNLINNDIEGNYGSAIILNNVTSTTISGNYIENNGYTEPTLYHDLQITSGISVNVINNYWYSPNIDEVVEINPTSTNLYIANNTFKGGSAGKKLIVCNGNTTQIQGLFFNNAFGSFDSSALDFGNSQFVNEYITNNQKVAEANQTIYERKVAKTGPYVIRSGKDGVVKFELNYDSDGTPIVNITSGNAGSETYKEIVRLMNDLTVQVRKALSFKTLMTNADITVNNTLFAATDGSLRFKDKDGNIHTITMS